MSVFKYLCLFLWTAVTKQLIAVGYVFLQVEGIQGILKSYTSALFNVSLAGPTLFGPVITAASLIASQSLENNQHKYYVLLIITVILRILKYYIFMSESNYNVVLVRTRTVLVNN